MKNVLISCVSLFSEKKMYVNGELKEPIGYSSENITINAYQTNEACAKFLIKKLARSGERLDDFIRVQSNSVVKNESGFTIRYLDESIENFCKSEELPVPQNHDCFLGDDEQAHRYDRVLSEISETVRRIATDDSNMGIYLDMAGGKRDNYIFIQLLTKLLSFYGYHVHTYYADITGDEGAIVNTDMSFGHMAILDAVNEFVKNGSATALRKCFMNTTSPTVKSLLKAMETFSDSIQICSTGNLSDNIRLLVQQLDQVEKYVEDDDNGLFVIKTMIPLIRSKLNIADSNGDIGILGVIRWCLDNNLIQQALTIYNEALSDMIIDKKLIVVDNKILGNDINRMMKGRHDSDRKNTKILCALGKTFENMCNNMQKGTKEMVDFIGRYRKIYKSRKTDAEGYVVYGNIEWTAASIFFCEEFIPKGVTLNIETELCRNIFSDYRFVTCARNRVNHASDSDTYDKLLISLFNVKCYPFSSYPNTFTPQNIKKDMFRAVDNLEKALYVGEK